MQWDSDGDMMVLKDLSEDLFDRIWEPEAMLQRKAELKAQLRMYQPLLDAHRNAKLEGLRADNPIVID